MPQPVVLIASTTVKALNAAPVRPHPSGDVRTVDCRHTRDVAGLETFVDWARISGNLEVKDLEWLTDTPTRHDMQDQIWVITDKRSKRRAEEPQVFGAHFDFGPRALGQHRKKPDTATILR